MSQQKKVAVLGLDGVPFGLLQKLFADGVMPSLSDFAAEGSLLKMTTALPPVSSVAWTSFMTGVNPGEHGIYGFTDVERERMSLRLPSFDDIRSPVVWDRIGKFGRKSLVINLPFTYPARPMPGALVAGFVVPIFERGVFPEGLIPWLKSKNYRIDVDARKGREDRRFLINDLFGTLATREEVMLHLMDEQPWDLFIGVITGTDRLHHFFYDAVDDRSHPYHVDFMDYYVRVDRLFRRFLERLPNDTRLLILSDHGFARLKTQVYVSTLLQRLGYLRFAVNDPRSLQDVHTDSRAFALDPSRVYINSVDRFSRGVVSAAEKPVVLARIRAELQSLRLGDLGIDPAVYDDSPDDRLFEGVFAAEEIYSGPCLHAAPDLVLVPKHGFDLKATLGVSQMARNDIFTGTHTHDDAFLIADDPAIADRLPKPHITDVTGLITEVLG